MGKGNNLIAPLNISGFQLGAILPSQQTFGCLETFLVVTTWGGSARG